MPATPQFLRTGADAMEALRKEQEAAALRREQSENRGPMRFYVQKNARGDGFQTHEIVFLDDDLTQAVHTYEHNVPGPNNDWSKSQQVTCIDDWANCPICRAAEGNEGDEFKPPQYGLYASILDMTPYTIKNGPRAGQVVEHTRKLDVIPMAMMDKYKKIFELCKKMHGTTRGLVLLVTKAKKNDARCGDPQMIEETGMLFDFMTEDELEAMADAEVVRDGKVVLEEGENIEPYDYEQVLAPKTEDELRRLFNLAPAAGSRAEERATTGSAGGGTRRRRRASAGGDEGGTTGEAEAPAGRTRRRRAAAASDDAGGDEGGHEEGGSADEAEAPRSSRARRRRAATGGDSDVDIPFEG